MSTPDAPPLLAEVTAATRRDALARAEQAERKALGRLVAAGRRRVVAARQALLAPGPAASARRALDEAPEVAAAAECRR